MSVSTALQEAIRTKLLADSAVQSSVGNRINDGTPRDDIYPYINFGPSDTSPYYDINDCVQGYDVSLQLDIWSNDQGSLVEAREITDAVCASLRRADLALNELHKLIDIEVTSRVFRDADNILGHGVVTVEAEIAQ